jgi:lysophospholipase L1-like esterase
VKIICVGDSITRAQVSADYVAILRDRLPAAEIVNAGVNYEPSAVLAARIDEIAAQGADLVTVLIGTNDLRALLSEKDRGSLRKRWDLTTDPTPAGYRQNLTTIVQRLRSQSSTAVALLSPPVIGEDLNSAPVRLAAEFGEIAREVAVEQGVAYLPLFERMTALLRESDRRPGTEFRPGRWLASTAAMQHFLLRRGFDAISRSRGLQLTTDTIHLNGRGAAMIADLIAEFAVTLPANAC